MEITEDVHLSSLNLKTFLKQSTQGNYSSQDTQRDQQISRKLL